MSADETPTTGEITDFLRQLRKYRGQMSGTGQALLDALVAAALNGPRLTPSEEVAPLWGAYGDGPYGGGSLASDPTGRPAGWEVTPWGTTYTARTS